jgi:hypothetical protein
LNARNRADVASKITASLKKLKEQKGRICFFCGNTSAAQLKGWVYPFIVAKDKFPNLYPYGNVETLNVCRSCAWKSVAAYSNTYFQTTRTGEESYTCANLFFADDEKQLANYLRNLQGDVAVNYFRNIPRGAIKYDRTYYPHEFLFLLTYYLSNQMREQSEALRRRIGALVLGYKLHAGSRKAIYDTFQVIQDLAPIIRAIRTFGESKGIGRARSKGLDPLAFLFRSMRESTKGARFGPHIFIERERFARVLLTENRIDWANLEEIVFRRLGEDKSIPFLDNFLVAVMGELNMDDKTLYEQVSKEGYFLARRLTSSDTVRSVKAKAYELRRARRMEEFLSKLNLIQLDTESRVDDRPFRDNEIIFQKLKAFFLIGFCNGLFSGKWEKGKEVEAK